MFPRWQVAASILIIVAITTLTITVVKNTGAQKSISSVNKKDTQQVTIRPAPPLVQSSTDTIKIEKEPTVQAPAASKIEQNKSVAANSRRAPVSVADNEETKKKGSVREVQGMVQNDSENAIASAPARLSAKDKAINADTNAIKELDEVVISGYAAQKKRDVSGSVSTVTNNSLRPLGWQAMNNYINENKKINNTDSLLKGEEIISFEVNKKGKLSSFKVIKSVSSSHDAEVIRLLKSGPALQPTNGKKQKYLVSITFN